MARIESVIQVAKSVDDVFGFLNVAKNHEKFIPNMQELKQTSEGAFGAIGTTARGLLSYFGIIKITVLYEIIEHEPNHKLAMKGWMGPVAFRDGYILSASGNGTEINFWLELDPQGWAKIISPFAGLIGKIHAWETLRNLKREIMSLGG